MMKVNLEVSGATKKVLIGKHIPKQVNEELLFKLFGKNYRLIFPDTEISDDFDAQRVNITVDRQGIIVRVKKG